MPILRIAQQSLAFGGVHASFAVRSIACDNPSPLTALVPNPRRLCEQLLNVRTC